MMEELTFLDDESLLDNLDEDKAIQVFDWHILVHEKAPKELEHAIYLAREINKFNEDQTTDDDKEDVLYDIKADIQTTFTSSEVHDSNNYDRIMSQPENKYGN